MTEGGKDQRWRLSLAAAVLGLGHPAVSAYWALGGTALLDTIGGAIERAGRERKSSVIAGLWAVGANQLDHGLGLGASMVLIGTGVAAAFAVIVLFDRHDLRTS